MHSIVAVESEVTANFHAYCDKDILKQIMFYSRIFNSQAQLGTRDIQKLDFEKVVFTSKKPKFMIFDMLPEQSIILYCEDGYLATQQGSRPLLARIALSSSYGMKKWYNLRNIRRSANQNGLRKVWKRLGKKGVIYVNKAR